MTEFLEKKDSIFERDEDGKLIAQIVILESLENKPKILATPISRGEFQRLFADSKKGETDKEQDNEIISKHCIKPLYLDSEIKDLKPAMAGAIVTGIVALSLDVSQEEVTKMSKKQAITMSEELLKKK